jgi:hypothetical protein
VNAHEKIRRRASDYFRWEGRTKVSVVLSTNRIPHTPYRNIEVQGSHNYIHPDCWIMRDEISWPPWSPDFFFWRHVKGRVHDTECSNFQRHEQAPVMWLPQSLEKCWIKHGQNQSICLSIYLSSYLWLYSPLLDLGRFFSFLILYTVGWTPCAGDQHVARPLPTHSSTQTQNKRTQTSMPLVGFEPTIPALERVKTVHAVDRAATAIGRN